MVVMTFPGSVMVVTLCSECVPVVFYNEIQRVEYLTFRFAYYDNKITVKVMIIKVK